MPCDCASQLVVPAVANPCYGCDECESVPGNVAEVADVDCGKTLNKRVVVALRT